jgi:predicted ATP-dependent endonuclease of OLD family
MKYVGPLREYPQRFYQTSGERFSDVGKKGEKAIEIIYTQGLLGNKAIECKLSDWLKRLGVALTIRFEEIGGGLYSLILVDPVSNTPVNVVDVGFGVSQIIPIIVATCLLEKDQTVIFEQPEIHLHPLGHMIMADLIVDATKHGRRFIIESHSEHLLLRIRRRIAEGKLTPDEVAVYYFEPKEGQIVLRELKIAESGRLADLPPGFMDERLEEAYKIAMAEK